MCSLGLGKARKTGKAGKADAMTPKKHSLEAMLSAKTRSQRGSVANMDLCDHVDVHTFKVEKNSGGDSSDAPDVTVPQGSDCEFMASPLFSLAPPPSPATLPSNADADLGDPVSTEWISPAQLCSQLELAASELGFWEDDAMPDPTDAIGSRFAELALL